MLLDIIQTQIQNKAIGTVHIAEVRRGSAIKESGITLLSVTFNFIITVIIITYLT